MSKITQQMLAQQLGLSRNCISKALNGGLGISNETRLRVQSYARAQGYQHPENSPTQQPCISLLTRARILGNQFWGEFIMGLETSLNEQGYQLLIHTVNSNEGAIQHLKKNHSQGAIMLWNHCETLLQCLLDERIPLLCYDIAANTQLEHLPFDVLMGFNREPVRQLTLSLIAQGHRKLMFVGDPESCKSFEERYEGFTQAIEEKPGVSSLIWHHPQEKMYEEGYFSTVVANRDTSVTAYICANDYMAIHLLKALKQHGVNVPNDVSVTGFDNLAEAELLSAPLTTVNAHVRELGFLAGNQILTRSKHPLMPSVVSRVSATIIPGASIGSVNVK